MEDVLIGVLAILVGGLLAFRGWLMLRTLIPLSGAFAGFFLGAGLVASFTGDGFLATLLGWVVGLLVAFVFGLLAYLYVAIVLFGIIGQTQSVERVSATLRDSWRDAGGRELAAPSARKA